MSADYSQHRRRQVAKVLRRERSGLAALSDGAQVLYAVSLLVCDGRGLVSKAAMSAAMADASTVQAARTLLQEARR